MLLHFTLHIFFFFYIFNVNDDLKYKFIYITLKSEFIENFNYKENYYNIIIKYIKHLITYFIFYLSIKKTITITKSRKQMNILNTVRDNYILMDIVIVTNRDILIIVSIVTIKEVPTLK